MTVLTARHYLSVLCLLLCVPEAAGETIELMDGSRLEGTVRGIGAGGVMSITPKDGGQKRIPCGEMLAVQFATAKPSPAPGQALVLLRNGDVLAGRITGGGKNSLAVDTTAFGKVSVPFDHIRAVQLEQPGTHAAPGNLPRELMPELLESPGDQDAVLLQNGDRLPGILASATAAGIQFNCALGEIPLEFGKLLGFVLAPSPAMKRPEGLFVRVLAIDRSLLTGSLEQMDARGLRIKPASGSPVEIARARIALLSFGGGRVAYLSDLEPVKVAEEPLVRDPARPVGEDYWWHYRRDRNVTGGPIRLAGRTWCKGLGVHSRCELTYRLGGEYSRLLATIGIDDETRGRGHVVFRVLADGRVIYPQEPGAGGISGKDKPVDISLDVSNATQVTLIVDFGDGLHILDRADWAGARLIRK